MRSAEIVGQLETETTVSVLPDKERQVRALGRLRDDPERMQEAWNDAVAAAGGKQPSIEKVEIAVAWRQPKPRYVPPKPPKPIKVVQRNDHPAKFSDAALAAVGDPVIGKQCVLDPFAGSGLHPRAARARPSRSTIGIEIEQWEGICTPRKIRSATLFAPARSRNGSTPAIGEHRPTFGNRMADHHDARDDGDRGHLQAPARARSPPPYNSASVATGTQVPRLPCARVDRGGAACSSPAGSPSSTSRNHIRRGKKQHVSSWHVPHAHRSLGPELQATEVIEKPMVSTAGENAERPCSV